MVTKLIIGWTLIALVLLTGCLSPEAQGPTGDAGLASATPARPSVTPVSVALDEPATPSMTPQVRQTPAATSTLSPTPTRVCMQSSEAVCSTRPPGPKGNRATQRRRPRPAQATRVPL